MEYTRQLNVEHSNQNDMRQYEVRDGTMIQGIRMVK